MVGWASSEIGKSKLTFLECGCIDIKVSGFGGTVSVGSMVSDCSSSVMVSSRVLRDCDSVGVLIGVGSLVKRPGGRVAYLMIGSVTGSQATDSVTRMYAVDGTKTS